MYDPLIEDIGLTFRSGSTGLTGTTGAIGLVEATIGSIGRPSVYLFIILISVLAFVGFIKCANYLIGVLINMSNPLTKDTNIYHACTRYWDRLLGKTIVETAYEFLTNDRRNINLNVSNNVREHPLKSWIRVPLVMFFIVYSLKVGMSLGSALLSIIVGALAIILYIQCLLLFEKFF